jgi:hypothetical protein
MATILAGWSPVTVVLGIVREVGRQVDDGQAEGAHAQACPRPPEATTEDRLEVLDALDGHIWHIALFLSPMMRACA